MPKRHIIPDTARCKQCGRRFDLPTLRERKDYKPGICPMCGGYLVSIKESEPVKGEQAGMLGVPGKVHTQKRPYEAGQMEFESYQKYKEAMSPKLHGMLEFLIFAPQRESTEAKLIEQYGDSVFHQAHEQGFITHTPHPSPSKRVVSITLKGREALQSTPTEKEDLHWLTVAELKQMCRQRGLPTDGGKEDLIRRLK